MTYSFNNKSKEKFQKITAGRFTAEAKLLAKGRLTRPLQSRLVRPQRCGVIRTGEKINVETVPWQVVDAPIEVQPGQTLLYDLGELFVGYFDVTIEAAGSPMDAPLLLQTRFAERVEELTIDASQVKSWLPLSWIQDDRRNVELLPQRVVYARRYSCRYVMIEPVGQSLKWRPRFLAPRFKAVSAVLNQPVSCLNAGPAWLKAIDAACVKTLSYTMQAVYEDGTKRDRRLWLLDFRMQAKVNYSTFKNTAVTKRCLYLFGAFSDEDGRVPADIFTRFKVPVADDLFWFDYQLQFVMALAEYGQATGDLATLTDLYPVAKRALDFVQNQLRADLTVGARNDIFVDWSTDCDKEAAVQAEVVMATRQFGRLAGLVGDVATQARTQNFLQRVERATLTQFYVPSEHWFVSGPEREVNLLSQIYMLLADLLDERTSQLVVDQLLKRFEIQGALSTPSSQGLLLEVLMKYGRKSAALALLKSYWGGMLAHGATTFWEVYDPHDPAYSPYGSLLLNSHCFGWSSYPAYLLRKYPLTE